MLRGYERTLQGALRHRGATVAAARLVLVLTAVLFVIVPKGFIPSRTPTRSR
jgi:multidrug efflux pump subunit AcrB